MTFDDWCAAHGGYLNDSDDAARAARLMARRAWDAAVAAELASMRMCFEAADAERRELRERAMRAEAELARVVAAERELDALRKDAERYRKLVASGKYCAASIGGGWGLGGNSTKAQLDAAADALPAVGAA